MIGPINWSMILDNLSEGIFAVDADDRVIVINRRLVELLQLPSGLIAIGDPLFKLMNFLRQRGEYASDYKYIELQEVLRQAHTRPYTLERQRPDGTKLLTRGNPMPDGGYVVAVVDITNLRVAEAEVLLRERRAAH